MTAGERNCGGAGPPQPETCLGQTENKRTRVRRSFNMSELPPLLLPHTHQCSIQSVLSLSSISHCTNPNSQPFLVITEKCA